MTDPQDIPAQLNDSLGSIWTSYAGHAPSDVHTVVEGNIVTCVLTDAVEDFDRSMQEPGTRRTAGGLGKPTSRNYKLEAVAAVVRLTGKRVAAFASSHDANTNIATEVFTLKPAATKHTPGKERQFAHAFWLSPLPPTCVPDEDD